MMDDCVEVEVDFSDEILKVIYMHMLKTGLNFNDAAFAEFVVNVTGCRDVYVLEYGASDASDAAD